MSDQLAEARAPTYGADRFSFSFLGAESIQKHLEEGGIFFCCTGFALVLIDWRLTALQLRCAAPEKYFKVSIYRN